MKSRQTKARRWIGRHGYGIELNTDYWRNGAKYCEDMEREALAPTLFEFAGIEI